MRNLRVYYGWTKINKIRKREAISIIYENCIQPEEKIENFIKKMQETVYVRMQNEKEEEDGRRNNRVFTEYSIYIHDKKTKGSLKEALEINNKADMYNVSEEERKIIYDKLYMAYINRNPHYREPEI